MSRLTSYFLIFFASGFSGLIYESIWTHYLKLFLGHAAYAQTLVLAIFMGGMAIGAGLCGRWTGRWRNLLLGYAVVEGLIGICALLFHPVFTAITDWALIRMLPGLADAEMVTTAKWSLATALILPQSILLGMTFPLMTAGILRRFPDHGGRTIATLYFVNSLGGGIGVLASGFWLINEFGLPGTIALAGAINLVLAWIVATRSRHDVVVRAPAPTSDSSALPGRLLAAMLVVSGLTGLSSFVYEIAWIRMLGLVLGSSTHAFELMLSAFIFGLAFGGWWMRQRIDTLPRPACFLGWVQVAMGVSALATLPLYAGSFDVMGWLMNTVAKTGSGYLQFSFASHGIAMAIMLPAAFCAGMTLPLITHILLRSGSGERAIGLVYGANTIGAIAGVMLAVHVGMPLLGLKNLMLAGAAVDIALGVALLWRFAPGTRALPVAAIAATAVIAITAGMVSLDPYRAASGIFRAGQKMLTPESAEILFHEDGKTATVSLIQHRDKPLRTIRTNGKTDASINFGPPAHYQLDEVTMTLIGAIPLLLRPQTQIAANIGIGSGLTSHVMLGQPSLRQLDTIEIEPRMVAAARGFMPRNANVFQDPRSRIAIEDAKSYFSTRRERYDAIISEPSNPWVSGISSLFSTEFYTHTTRHLAADGIFLQWLQLYEIDELLVMSVIKAIDGSFSDYAIFGANYGDILIVATPDGNLPSLPDRLPDTQLTQELARVGIASSQDLRSRLIVTKKMLRPLLESYEIAPNSDYYPVLDQNANRARFMGSNAHKLALLPFEPLPLVEMLAADVPIARQPAGQVPLSSTHHFGKPHPATFATYFKHHLAGAADAAATSIDAAHDYPARAAALVQGCRTPAGNDHVFAALEFAFQVVPYLDRSDASEIWPALSGLPCFRDLAPADRDWASLLLAVGQRDASAMASLSRGLLEAKRDTTPARRKYLLATALLGLVASGQKPAARELWARYRQESFPAEIPLLYRLLVAHAAS